MTALFSHIRSAATTGVMALIAVMLPAEDVHAGVPVAQVTDRNGSTELCIAAATQKPEWTAMARFLQSRGLALATQCQGSRGAMHVKLVVLDAVKASALLRGPLADGEVVETGEPATETPDTEVAGSDDWSPDVHYNRKWLSSAMALHHLVRAADGGWRLNAGRNGVQMALR